MHIDWETVVAVGGFVIMVFGLFYKFGQQITQLIDAIQGLKDVMTGISNDLKSMGEQVSLHSVELARHTEQIKTLFDLQKGKKEND